MTSPRRLLKNARRFTVYLLVAALVHTVRWLPYAWLRRLLPALIGRVAPRFLRQDAFQSLTIAYGDQMDAAQREALLRRLCRHLGHLVAELFHMHRQGGRFFDARVDSAQARALLEPLFRSGRPVVGLTGHLGNWEMVAQQFRLISGKTEFGVVGKELTNRWIDAMVVAHRRRSGLITLYQHESPRKVLRSLEQYGIVGIVPDQDVDGLKGIFVPFFGHPAYTPVGPAWLAVKGKAVIAPTFLVREGDRLRVHCEPPIEADPDATDQDAEIERLTVAWSAAVERAIRRWPDQWMWFHRRWRTTPERLIRRGRGRNVRGPALP